jgi:hypothetical protein
LPGSINLFRIESPYTLFLCWKRVNIGIKVPFKRYTFAIATAHFPALSNGHHFLYLQGYDNFADFCTPRRYICENAALKNRPAIAGSLALSLLSVWRQHEIPLPHRHH